MTLFLYFDGACEPNPGTGSYGAVVTGLPAGPYRLRGVVPVKVTTNNVAEWTALREGLEYVVSRLPFDGLAGAELTIRGDSQLVIHQLTGKWACRAEGLQPLLAECRGLLAKIEAAGCRWSAEWIPREQNAEADALSVEAWCGVTGRPFPERRRA